MEIAEEFIRRALRLAAKGAGTTSPNPMVGAVVVRQGKIVGQGYHHKAGEPHAEILALRQAGGKARGATLYLNLEPCDHFGRTPPCTQAILEAGVKRVIAGMKDPNPRVSGRGLRRLREAGVDVMVGVLEEECRELNRAFCKYITTRTPWVTLKVAASLDGKIATRTGDARWISGEASRNYVHQLRQAADAVMVGIGTVLQDDPLLTVRLPGKKITRQPLRIVVDSHLKIPLRSQLVLTAGRYPTLVATTKAASPFKMDRLAKAQVDILLMPADRQRRVSLPSLMGELGHRGIVSILLEGGPTLNAGALKENLVDRLIFFLSPKLIGGEKAPGAIGGEGVLLAKEAQAMKILQIKRFGPDLMIEGSLIDRE